MMYGAWCLRTRGPRTCDTCDLCMPYSCSYVCEGWPSAGVACGEQAFRQMSLKLHPDKQRGAGTAAAAARFSEVRAAYDLLQDAERRALYDMHGMEAVDDGQPRWAAVHGGLQPGTRALAARIHRVAALPTHGCRQRGEDFRMELSVSLRELYTGAARSLTIKRLVVCKGCKHALARDTPRCRSCGQCPNEARAAPPTCTCSSRRAVGCNPTCLRRQPSKWPGDHRGAHGRQPCLCAGAHRQRAARSGLRGAAAAGGAIPRALRGAGHRHRGRDRARYDPYI